MLRTGYNVTGLRAGRRRPSRRFLNVVHPPGGVGLETGVPAGGRRYLGTIPQLLISGRTSNFAPRAARVGGAVCRLSRSE
jgi:hypothetical protein